ncbi:hypothetical protein LYNGBM3L_40170 [Moorena producens 3L]|uniref:Uncharacterized protein n=1 Tax=Moorena producens 3L TaxID=489825 RepID=F4XVV8_9CYAN|nr:hypothetical protein [Moorena producens]EGJ31371.1 hypothetical protein LYNGBM3L_40170 [Moorena producens 3L]
MIISAIAIYINSVKKNAALLIIAFTLHPLPNLALWDLTIIIIDAVDKGDGIL